MRLIHPGPQFLSGVDRQLLPAGGDGHLPGEEPLRWQAGLQLDKGQAGEVRVSNHNAGEHLLAAVGVKAQPQNAPRQRAGQGGGGNPDDPAAFFGGSRRSRGLFSVHGSLLLPPKGGVVPFFLGPVHIGEMRGFSSKLLPYARQKFPRVLSYVKTF